MDIGRQGVVKPWMVSLDKKLKRWILIGSGICIIGLGALVSFLIVESRFFVRQAWELIRLKEDYANYVLAAKRMIAECEPQQADESKKKKVDDTDSFLVVNRDAAYLRRCAARYARARHVPLVEQLYGSQPFVPVVERRKRRSRVQRESRRQVLAPDSNVLALKAEYPFILPLKAGTFRFTSRFGPRRRRNGSWGFHYGLDMAAPRGTPVKSVAHGVVVEARHARGFGNTVVVSHSNKIKTRYAHLSKIDVRVGDTVEQGQRIGRVGNTGHTRGKNGVHLHFEVLVYGKQVNPSYFLG